jgi:ParB family chromosome partitioning protein
LFWNNFSFSSTTSEYNFVYYLIFGAIRMDNKKVKRSHLGRGLESLLGPATSIPISSAPESSTPETKPIGSEFPPDTRLDISRFEIPISKIKANPYQPRTVWKEEELNELAQSIRENGVIQPIIVRKIDDKYEIIAGERRFRAAIQAGLENIPALVRTATDEEMLELAIVENIHRSDLNAIERAKAYQNFIKTFSLSQTEAAQKLGEDRSVISNYMRLLDLPQDLQAMLSNDQLSMGHARALLALPTDELRRKLANRAMAGRLSVREVEQLVRKYLEDKQEIRPEKKEKESHIVDLERQLQTILGTKVNIEPKKKGNRGRIIIDYYSLDEFERLTERMGLMNNEGL